MARTTLLNPVAQASTKEKAVKQVIDVKSKASPKAVAKRDQPVAPVVKSKPQTTKPQATPQKSIAEKTPTKPTTIAKVNVPKAVTSEADTPKVSTSKANTPKANIPKAIQITGDSDGDGLSNEIELALGMNPMSTDSDADGVPDFIEIGVNNKEPQDSDQDGKPDALDTDDDNDGILTKLEDVDNNGQVLNDDTDKDGVPNYLDANDDGDSRLTKLEGASKDTDNDGIPDYLDHADGVSAAKKSNVVVLYDERDKSKPSIKKQAPSFNLATKPIPTDSK